MTIDIDLGEYGIRPFASVPPELGPGLAGVISTAIAWSDQDRAAVAAAFDAADGDGQIAELADQVISGPLGDLGSTIGTTSCQTGMTGEHNDTDEPDEPWTAGPWLDVAYRNHQDLPGVHEVAVACLARDFSLIAEVDFETLTGWWVAAGQPLPEPHPGARFATDEEIEKTAMRLRISMYDVQGWPLAAASEQH